MGVDSISLYPDIFPGATRIVRQGYAYWRGKAAGRPAPTWAEIDPSAFVALLPNVVVVHAFQNPENYVERIIGQTVVDFSHSNRMHKFWRDRADCGPASKIWRIMSEVVATKRPSLNKVPYVGPNRDYVQMQTAVCPISDDGKIINKTLSFVDFIPKGSAT